MTFTVSLQEISLFFIALGFFILVLYLIPAVLQIRQTAKALEDLSKEGRTTLEGLNLVLNRTEAYTEDIAELIKRFRDTGLKFVSLADLVADRLRSPVITLVSFLIGLDFALRHLDRKEGGEDVGK